LKQGRKLSEAQISDMEAFLGQLQIVLPVLGGGEIMRFAAIDRVTKIVRPYLEAMEAASGAPIAAKWDSPAHANNDIAQ